MIYAGLLFTLIYTNNLIAKEQSTVIMLASASKETELIQVANSIKAQFANSYVNFKIHWVSDFPAPLPAQEQLAANVAKETGALAVFWIDLELTERAYFYLTRLNSQKVLVRRLDGTGEYGMADALALICKSAVDSMLEGGTIGVNPPPEPIKKQPLDTKKTKPSTHTVKQKKQLSQNKTHLSLEFAYAMSIPSADHTIQNGASFSLSLLFINRIRVFAGYTVFQSITESNSFAKLELKRHPFNIGIGAVLHKKRWTLGVDASLVLDYLKRIPTALDPQVVVEEPYGNLTVQTILALRSTVLLFNPVYLFLTLGAEFHFIKQNFNLDGGPALFNDLCIIRPCMLLGIKIKLF